MRKSRAGNDKVQCNVFDCNNDSKRSLSFKKVQDALPKLKFENVGKKIHLCREHYREFKKVTKEKRKLETLTWD